MILWAAVVTIGLGTYLTRLSFIAILARTGVPAWLERALAYVAPAVFAAIIAPAVLLVDGNVDPANPRAAAALLAGVAAWRLRSVGATIVVGMGALWLIEALV